MRPTLEPGDRLHVDPTAYDHALPGPGDLVVLRDPDEDTRLLVKRVAAVGPGNYWATRRGFRPVVAEASPPPDSIEEVRVDPGELLVVSDRPEGARDSRRFGPVPVTAVIGRVVSRYAPAARRTGFGRT